MIALLDATRFTVTADGCWTLNRVGNRKGYKQMPFGGRRAVVGHRVAYMLQVGPIPDGYEIDHLCRNTGCMNPAHLEAVTPAENMRRRAEHLGHGEYRTHCANGHEMTGDNVHVYSAPRSDTANHQIRTQRRCRTCMTAAFRRVAAANREAAESVRGLRGPA